MRRLIASHSRHVRGMTLIELMIALVVAGVLLVAGVPAFTDYMHNSRLREGGNMLYTEALLAQSEAIKRNTTIRLSTAASQIQTIDRSDPANPVVLRTRTLPQTVLLAAQTLDFGGEGRPTPFGTAGSFDLSSASVSCSTDTRCPGMRIDAGGSVRMCADYTYSCP